MEETESPSNDPPPFVDEPMQETSENVEQSMETSVNDSEQVKLEDAGVKPSTSLGSPRRVSNIKRLVSPEDIQQIKSVYCSGLPEELSNKEQIKEYFSEFGEVVRVYMSLKKMACTVHYKDHKSAANAKKYGGVSGNKRFSIFWSQSSISKTTKSPPAKKEEKKTDTTEKERKVKDASVEEGSKITHKAAARRKVSESSPSKVTEGKPLKSSRSRGGKGKGKSDYALTTADVDLVFSKNATAKDLQEVLKKPAKTPEEKYRVLEARDKLMRMERVKQLKSGIAGRLHGTCPDMCPEKERYLRESQHQVHPYELKQTKEYSMNHAAAIKQYSRSSADQEEPLPHELRPSKVLMMAMNYIVCNIMDLSERKEENLRDWYFYVWDRTRAIRKDITQQQLCDMDSVLLVEQCARFHIHCAERLVSEDLTVFDEKINNENLTKCLQTLKHLYHDLAMKGEFCSNEAEFRGYIILMNLGDGNFMWEVQDLRQEIQQSIPVRFAVQVYFALSSGNYVRFFKHVKSTTYLNACLMHRYFTQVRTKALAAIARSYSFQSKIAQFPVSNLANLLNYESIQQAETFCEHYGLELDSTRKYICLGRNTLLPTHSVFPPTRAINIIESKRKCSIGEVIVGGNMSESIYQAHVPHSSFNESGMLRNEAWNALDQGESKPEVILPIIAPAEPEVDKESLVEELSGPVLEEIIKETVVQEVRQVSENLMEYVNKLSVAFLSMYCETFVREFVRDICSSTWREMKNQKILEEREAQKTRKMYEELIEKASKEITAALVVEVTDSLCKSEACSVVKEEREKHTAVKEITTELLNETTNSMVCEVANELISFEHEEKARKLEALSESLKKETRRYYLNCLLKAYEKKKQLKISMQGFPAWISSMSLEEQVKWFGSLSHSGEFISSKRNWSTAFGNGLNVSTQTYPLISIEDVVIKSLMKSFRKSGSLKNQLDCILQWKIAISVPETWEGRKDVNLASEWINRCFILEPSDSFTSKPLFQLEIKLNEFVSLDITIHKIVGDASVEKCSFGMNGVLFILQGKQDTVCEDSKRLINIVNQYTKFQPCQLAVLVIGLEKYPKHELLSQLNLDYLVKRKLVTNYCIFYHEKNSRELPHVQLENSLCWLAQNAEFPPPLEVQPLKTLMQQLLIEEFWVSVLLRSKESEMLQLIIQDPNDLISIYNEAVQLLADQCCCKNYLNFQGKPDSQIDLLNENYLAIFKHLPAHWFQSNYLVHIKKLVESAKIPKISSLPAKNLHELSIILQDYCSYVACDGKASAKAYTIVMQILEQELVSDCQKKNSHRIPYYSPWPSVLKVLSATRLESIDFKDLTEPECSVSIIVNKDIKRIIESEDSHWWMKTSIIPTLFEQVQNETSREISKQSLEDADSQPFEEVSLTELKESLDRMTAALSKQSSELALLNSDIEDSMNLGHLN